MYLHLKTWFRITRLMLFYKKFSIKRFLFLISLAFLFSIVWLLLLFFRFLDDIFFPGYRKVKIKEPVFIIGNPRSGTTYLYDLVAQDKKRFAQPLLYQSLFCSVTLYKLLGGMIRRDIKRGNPLKDLIFRSNKFFFRFKSIHEIRLDMPEEDEAIFFLSLLTPSIFFICPYPQMLPWLTIIDDINPRVRKRLIKYYKSCIKRYMYVYGKDKVYLCKNVMSTGKISMIREAFPDAKIIHPVRHPYKAIPSMISFYHKAWKLHSPEYIGATEETLALAKCEIKLYNHILQNKDKLGKNFILVKFKDMIKKPKLTMAKLYKQMGMNLSDKCKKNINKCIKNSTRHKSTHKYSLEEYGLSRNMLYKELKDVFKFYGFKK